VELAQGYRRLLELALSERELIAQGRFDELPALGADRAALARALPSPPPAEARALLEEAKGIVDANVAVLASAIEQTRADLAHLRRGRVAVASYGATTPARGLDLRG
jgi:hypothetical protein